MNTEYFTKFADLAKKSQEPFQALAELNVKTLQGFTYLRPEEFASLKKPEELLGKQIELAIANGHKTLDYLQKSFQICERAMLSCAQEAKEAKAKAEAAIKK